MNSNHVMAADVSIRSVGTSYRLYHNPKPLKTTDGDVYYRTYLPEGYEI